MKSLLFSFVAISSLFIASSVSAETTRASGHIGNDQSDNNNYVNLQRGATASLLIQGLGSSKSSDLDCAFYMLDDEGAPHVIKSDEDDTNTCLVEIIAPLTGKYQIFILNHGAGQDYRITLVANNPGKS